ncbi:MAG TPA: DUF664 domain-containing protein [Streptosporangiaceae bacterium]|nr:DUF664 domain-containing protein [Streptosporangiaceae bacterium]
MTSADLLVDAFSRVRKTVYDAAEGLRPDQLAFQPEPRANSIAWLVWHLTRIQDDHIADLADTEQAWISDGWVERFGFPFDPMATGYGHGAEEVAEVRVDSVDLLTGYYDAVHVRTTGFVAALTDDDLPRIVDKSWDPPVTLAVRLVSVISDNLQHAGQAMYLRGMIERGAA